jgi:DNA-binding PadR family transcriptional regulator
MSRPSDLVQGTLDLLILKILALEPLHGWAIGQRLKQVSADVLQVSDGSLYPARRLSAAISKVVTLEEA